MQLYALCWIAVRRRQDLATHAGVDVELFAQLASQAGLQRLASIAFAAGKFPESFEVDAALPSRHEEPVAALDDGGGYDDCFSHAQFFFIGQTRHFGFLAVHTVAPKSISAWLKS